MNLTITGITLLITQMSLALDWEEDQKEEQPSQMTNIPSCFEKQQKLPKPAEMADNYRIVTGHWEEITVTRS